MDILDGFLRTVRRAGRSRRAPARPSHRPTLEALESRWVPSAVDGTSAIAFNFNGTPVAAGDTLWFSSAFKASGLPAHAVSLHFTHGSIAFTANGTAYSVSTPDADVTLSPSATTATTTFDATLNAWETTLPMKWSGNGFLDGVAFPLASPLPGGIKNVTWQGQFSGDTPGVSVNWQWAAAAYTRFGGDYNALHVKPVDDNHLSVYPNSDHAGAPEAFLTYVVGGATGGGGANVTGSLSATVQVTPTTLASLSGVVNDQAGTGLGGVVVALTTTNSQGQVVTLYATTDSHGFYQFTDLQAGTYTLSVVPPSGYQNAAESVGTVNGAGSGTDLGSGTIGTIGLTPGGVGRNYGFVEQLTSSGGLPNS